ncbi:hypothetical protein AMS58_00235 [Pseudoalteromonas porphyrae]|uniref:SRPBCC family protein n=1 Tax=Pseudoalteromonas TaxID=53246 RepID=UPI0006BA81D4|nr:MULTISPECIES: SRPBCC family protein [Pseudoalteromonas]KPH96532.1 hypothetical protein AMS58_00235 [Pseudoalteromonas porphyrae]
MLLLVLGLVLPQQYQVNKSIIIQAEQVIIEPYINDFSKWQLWSPWEAVDPSIIFDVSNPSSGVGAHQFWQSNWGFGEMTITNITPSTIHLNILFNEEHIATGTINFTRKANGNLISCTLLGEVTTPILGGYLALISQYILTNTVELGLNNLKTVVQLQTIQDIEVKNDNTSSTGEN